MLAESKYRPCQPGLRSIASSLAVSMNVMALRLVPVETS
jgi:hypothetical protein